jgi:hypothetical protein
MGYAPFRFKTETKHDWEILTECKVYKVVKLVNCTETEARNNPWDYAEYEEEIGQINWTIKTMDRIK